MRDVNCRPAEWSFGAQGQAVQPGSWAMRFLHPFKGAPDLRLAPLPRQSMKDHGQLEGRRSPAFDPLSRPAKPENDRLSSSCLALGLGECETLCLRSKREPSGWIAALGRSSNPRSYSRERPLENADLLG